MATIQSRHATAAEYKWKKPAAAEETAAEEAEADETAAAEEAAVVTATVEGTIGAGGSPAVEEESTAEEEADS